MKNQKNVEDANKDENGKSTLPDGTTVTVGDDGTATVTYPDKTTDTIQGSDLVRPATDAEFIKTGEVKEQSEIFEEFDITMSVIDSLLIRTQDSEGKIHISWGSQRITE